MNKIDKANIMDELENILKSMIDEKDYHTALEILKTLIYIDERTQYE